MRENTIFAVTQFPSFSTISAHSSRSRGLLLASDDAESAAYPTVDKGSGNLGSHLPFNEFRTPTERPPPLARHAATDRSSIEPDREGLWTKHALGPTASLPSGVAHQGLAAGADGLRQEVGPGLGSRRRPSRPVAPPALTIWRSEPAWRGQAPRPHVVWQSPRRSSVRA